MPVVEDPRVVSQPPSGPGADPEALIEEARRRTRRRRRRFGAVIAGSLAVAGFGNAMLGGGGGGGGERAAQAEPPSPSNVPTELTSQQAGLVEGVPATHNGPITVIVHHQGKPDDISALDDKGKPHLLWQCPAECNAILSFAWSPDGTRIVVSVTTPNGYGLGPPVPYDGLHVIDIATGRDTQVVKAGTLPGRHTDRPVGYSGLALSRDSRWIAYTGRGKYIGIVNVTGTKQRALRTGIREVSDPTWLGRGHRIGFSGRMLGQGGDAWLISNDGSDVHQISRRINVAGSWSPTRDMVAYPTRCGYRLLSSAGKHLTTVKRCPRSTYHGYSTDPTRPDRWWYGLKWSPDGTRLMMVSSMFGGDSRGVWVIDRDGSNLRRLTHDFGFNTNGGAG